MESALIKVVVLMVPEVEIDVVPPMVPLVSGAYLVEVPFISARSSLKFDAVSGVAEPLVSLSTFSLGTPATLTDSNDKGLTVISIGFRV